VQVGHSNELAPNSSRDGPCNAEKDTVINTREQPLSGASGQQTEILFAEPGLNGKRRRQSSRMYGDAGHQRARKSRSRKRKRDRLNDGLDGKYWAQNKGKERIMDSNDDEGDALLEMSVDGGHSGMPREEISNQISSTSSNENSGEKQLAEQPDLIPVKDIYGGLDGRYWAVLFTRTTLEEE